MTCGRVSATAAAVQAARSGGGLRGLDLLGNQRLLAHQPVTVPFTGMAPILVLEALESGEQKVVIWDGFDS